MRTSCLDLEEYGLLRFVSHREIGAEGVEEVSLEHDLCEGLIIKGRPRGVQYVCVLTLFITTPLLSLSDESNISVHCKL